MWFLNTTTLLPLQSNLSIWLSSTPTYNSANGSYQCADSFSPTQFVPDKHTIECDQTLSRTRYVSVWRPITAAASSIYIYEMRVLRAVASAVCACRVTAPVASATYVCLLTTVMLMAVLADASADVSGRPLASVTVPARLALGGNT